MLPGFNMVHLNIEDAYSDAFNFEELHHSKSRKDDEKNSVLFTIGWDDPSNHIFVDDYPELQTNKGKVIIGDGLRYRLQYVKTESVLFDGEHKTCTMITLETEVNTLESFKSDTIRKKRQETLQIIENKDQMVYYDLNQFKFDKQIEDGRMKNQEY